MNNHSSHQRVNTVKDSLNSRRPQRHGSRSSVGDHAIAHKSDGGRHWLDGGSVGDPGTTRRSPILKDRCSITNQFGFFHYSWIPDVQSAATRAFAPGSLLSLGTTRERLLA